MEQGTLALINYVAKVKETGEVLEVTKEEDAKALAVYDASSKYEPKLVAVGEQWVLKGLDEALLKAKLGEKLTVEIPPEKGFGQRDPSKIRLIPIRRFGDDASRLKVGEQVQVDNRIGTVRFIGSGRVQVDFNHRLAGKNIIYDVEVVKTLSDPKEIALALIKRRIPVDESKVQLELKEDSATIQLPQDVLFMDGIQYAKKAVSDEIFKFVKGISRVTFTEIFESPEAPKQKEAEKKEAEEVREEVKVEAKEAPKSKKTVKRASKKAAQEEKSK
ncbi:MAG: FKBP-type peptidyl-prolyl cis-trans isomerase [Conexivisphaerales archaeon]